MYYSAIAYPGIKLRYGMDDISWGFNGIRKGRLAEIYLPGCNLKCEFCVANYLTDLGEVRGIRWIDAGDLVRSARGLVDVLGFSGGEPSIHVEYVADAFSNAQDQGIRTIIESNGYMTKNTAEKLAKHTNFVAFGLKASLDSTFYRRKLGIVDTQPIRDTARTFVENGTEVLFTNVTDPNLWDDRRAFEELSRWIVHDLGAEVPLALAPLERVGIPPPWTDERVYIMPREQRVTYVQKYQQIATEAGLQNVHAQLNSRKVFEEHQEELRKMGLFKTMEKLGMSPTSQRWG